MNIIILRQIHHFHCIPAKWPALQKDVQHNIRVSQQPRGKQRDIKLAMLQSSGICNPRGIRQMLVQARHLAHCSRESAVSYLCRLSSRISANDISVAGIAPINDCTTDSISVFIRFIAAC